MNTIFAEFEEFFRKGLQTIKERKGRLDIELGREILGEVNKTVALESIEGKAKTAEALGQFMMACEAAQSELTRMRGISYSLALKHSDVIGIDVTPANFSTHVGKKNYDTALENIKGYLLIGASVALAAGIGYLVFKLLSAKKERPSKGKEIVAVAKEMNKANELFSSIDLSVLPKEIQDKFQQKAFQDSHVQIQRIANYDQYVRQGYELEVANQLTIREARVLDDICLQADGGSWVVECYNRHYDKVLENIKTFIEITEKMGEVEDDILGIDLNVLEGRVDAARYSRHLDYNQCALSSGYIGNANPLFEDWAEWLTSESLMDLAPQLAAVKKGVVTPSSGEYEKFNSSKEKMGKLGDRFEKASKKLQDTFDSDLINNLVAKLKFDLEELEMMRNMVKQESKAIAESFRTKITAAKIYSARINEFLDELIDEDMKKQIQEQLKKAITALPKRVMVTEGIDDNSFPVEGDMGLESWGTVAKAAGLVGAMFFLGYAVGRLIAVFTKNKTGQEKAKRTAEEIEKIKEDMAERKKNSLAIFSNESRTEFRRSLVNIVTGKESLRVVNAVNGTNAATANAATVTSAIRSVIDKALAQTGLGQDDVPNAGKAVINATEAALGNWENSISSDAAANAARPLIKEFKDAVKGPGGLINLKADMEKIKEAASKLVSHIRDFDSAGNEVLPQAEAKAEVEKNYFDRWMAFGKNDLKYIERAQVVDGKKLQSVFENATPTNVKEEDLKDLLKNNAELREFKEFTKVMMEVFATATLSMSAGWINHSRDMTSLIHMYLKESGGGEKGDKMATESITGDGVSLIEHEETDDFLDTPDHEQAGYRFDLREGVDGANLMAMESWSLGAKVALGIGAAVAVLGIGALIASTVIKRGSTVKDRHATPETTEKLIENIEQLDSQSMKVVQRIQELQSKFNSSKQKSEYPQVDSELRDLLRKANRIQSRTVERNGQEMDQMSAIIEELGDDTTLQLQRLLAIGLASPHRSYFEVLGDQGWSGAVMSVYENVVSKATHEIDIGRDSSAILEDILNWWESSEGKHAKYRLQGAMSDPETVRGLIDNHWGFDVGESGFRASHRTSVLNALTLVVKAQDGLVKTHGRVVESLNRYTLPEKTIEKFKKLEENSRGNRDASASVVRRIEEFKPYFALYTRMARHETEVIDSILGFADRFLKAYAKIGKRDMDDVRQLSMEVSKYEAEAWAK